MEIFSIDRLATYLAQGGVTMWFIGALSILGVGCALERFWNLRRGRIVPDGLSADIVSLWKSGRLGEVSSLCRTDGSMLSRIVEAMLQYADSTDYAEVKLFAEDKAGRELRLESRNAGGSSHVAPLG